MVKMGYNPDQHKEWEALQDQLAKGDVEFPSAEGDKHYTDTIKRVLVEQANAASGPDGDKFTNDDVSFKVDRHNKSIASFSIGKGDEKFTVSAQAVRVQGGQKFEVFGMKDPGDEEMTIRGTGYALQKWKEIQQDISDGESITMTPQALRSLMVDLANSEAGKWMYSKETGRMDVKFTVDNRKDVDGDGINDRREIHRIAGLTVEALPKNGQLEIIGMKGPGRGKMVELGAGVKIDVPIVEAVPDVINDEGGQAPEVVAAEPAEGPNQQDAEKPAAKETKTPEEGQKNEQAEEPKGAEQNAEEDGVKPEVTPPAADPKPQTPAPKVDEGVNCAPIMFEDDGKGVQNRGSNVEDMQAELMKDPQLEALLSHGGCQPDDGIEGPRTRQAAEIAATKYAVKVPDGQSAAEYFATEEGLAALKKNMTIDYDRQTECYKAAGKIENGQTANNFNAQNTPAPGVEQKLDNELQNDGLGADSQPVEPQKIWI